MWANNPEMAKKWAKEEQKEAVQVNVDKVLKNSKIKKLMKRLGIRADKSKESALKILNYLARNPHALAAIKVAFESVKEERDYKAEYKKYGSSTKSKKYRAELNQYNRKKGTYGNNDGKDASHKGGKIVGFEKESINRGRAEKSRLKKEDITMLEAKFTDDTLVSRLKHWSKQHKGTGIGYGHVLGHLAVHMKEMGWNKSYKEVARIAVELGKKRKVESVNEMPNFGRGTSGLPKGFIDMYTKIVKKLSKGKGYATLSRSDKKKVWATLGKIYNESVNEKKIVNSALRKNITSTFKDLDKKFPKKVPRSQLKKITDYLASKHPIYNPRKHPELSYLSDYIADEFYNYRQGKKNIKRAISSVINLQRGYPPIESIKDTEGKLTNEELYNTQGEQTNFKKGDLVKDINPDCPHVGSVGGVIKVGKGTITFKVTNNGKNYQEGDELEKTVDQMVKLSQTPFADDHEETEKQPMKESVDESDLGLTYKKGKTVKVTHKKSGKELVIIDKPNVKREYEKIGYFTESVIVEWNKYRLGGLLDSKLKKRLERTIKIIGGKVDSVGMDYITFRIDSMDLQRLPAVIKKLDRNKNVWIGDKRKNNIWDRRQNIDRLESVEEMLNPPNYLDNQAPTPVNSPEDENLVSRGKRTKKSGQPKFGTFRNESINEKISKEEWAEYPKWARKLKPYMKRLLKIPVKVRVIKQANHNPWIEVRVARFGKDIIPNDFRKRALKAIGGGRPRDMDNIHYGNITAGSVSLKHDQWVKMLGNKVR